MQWKNLLPGLILLLFIASCAKPIPYEASGRIDVYFCPEHNCSKELISLIRMANVSLECAFFELEDEAVIRAIEAMDREVETRVFLDERNRLDMNLDIDGMRFDESSSYSHNKFCIIDESIVFTGSYNPTENGANLNNNNIAVVFSHNLAGLYSEEFDELYLGGPDKKSRFNVMVIGDARVESFFCPDECGGRDAAEILKKLIRSANNTIEAAMFSFTQDDLGEELRKARQRGVEINVLFESLLAKGRGSEFQSFLRHGICAETDANKGMMHHKFMIIDRSIVITGSTNFSHNGLFTNDENILIIHDKAIAEKYFSEFCLLADHCIPGLGKNSG